MSNKESSRLDAGIDPVLPVLDVHLIPGVRFARRLVRSVLSVFACGAVGVVFASATIVVRTTAKGDGSLEPLTVRRVRVAEQGLIAEVLVRTGDTVQVGQTVAVLDTIQSSVRMHEGKLQSDALINEIELLSRSIPITRQRAAARVLSAEARVALARAAVRQRMAEFELFGDPDSLFRASEPQGHVGIDAAVAEYKAARAVYSEAVAETLSIGLADLEIARKHIELSRSRARMPELMRERDALSVRSPTFGIVVTEDVQDRVGAAVTRGETILEVADFGQWRAIVTLDERDASRVHVGDIADVEILALASRGRSRFAGTVSFVGRQSVLNEGVLSRPAMNVPASRRYRLEIGFSPESLRDVQSLLRRGYAVRARVVSRRGTILALIKEYLLERRGEFR